MLGVLYQRLGDAATLEAVDGSAPRPVQVKFDLAGGDMLEGAHIADQPSLRIAASEVQVGVKRGDAFTIGGIVYKASEAGTPLLDGAEYSVPLNRVTPR